MVFTPAKTRAAEGELKYFLSKSNPIHFGGAAVCVAIEFTIQRPKSVSEKKRLHPSCGFDLDNACKSVMDCANGILWNDDRQVVTLIARKVYGEQPSIKLSVWLKDRPIKNLVRLG